jgi:CheY-like chemotaxis protein
MSPNTIPILLVENSARDVELTIAALEDLHFADRVVVVRDGGEALDYIYKRGKYTGSNDAGPALVLLDLKLPRVDGFEVLTQLKGDPKLRHTPVVMLTSSAEECDLVRSYRLGANAYVVKPAGFDDFHRTIQDLVKFWGVHNKCLSRPMNDPSN